MDQIFKQLSVIKTAFNGNSLPGIGAMLEMAPLARGQGLMKQENTTMASVLLVFYPNDNELYFPLIERASKNPQDKHRGQIAFPGGKREPGDETDWACALRESEEELGITANEVNYLGSLTPNYIPVSNFRVHPFVGFLPAKPRFARQVEEVAAILEVPLRQLLLPDNRKTGKIKLANGTKLDDVPYFNLAGHKVWGATAMMLNEFVALMRNRMNE